MAQNARTLGSWQQTRNTLVETLAIASNKQASVPFSNDPDSEYQILQMNIDKTIEKIREHALNGIRNINKSIATGNVLGQIKSASQAAKSEADKIERATASIKRITKLVNVVSKVVEDIGEILL